MPEAARKTLFFHLQRMLFHEPGTRLGQDAEELHDMRVATRRMRAALALFSADLNDQALAPFLKDLRRTGRALGSVRDLDVFREKLQAYTDKLPAGQSGGLEPLLAAWEAQRTLARDALLAYLDGERYASFRAEFGRSLEAPEAWREALGLPSGEGATRRLRWAVPAVVYERMAEARACAEPLARPGAALADFHRLRIAGKRLRYALEFFEEVLGSETADLIKAMKDLQDHLGNLQDAVVACGLLRDFLTWGTWGQPQGKRPPQPAAPVVAPGVAAYLAFRQAELQHLVDTFAPAWAPVQSPEFGAKLRAALAALW